MVVEVVVVEMAKMVVKVDGVAGPVCALGELIDGAVIRLRDLK